MEMLHSRRQPIWPTMPCHHFDTDFRPRNVQELQDFVRQRPCNCTSVECTESYHRQLSYHLRSRQFPSQPTRDFNAMYLADEAINSFNWRVHELPRSQREAVDELNAMLRMEGRARDNPLRMLAWTHANRNVRNQDMENLLRIFNKVFFLDSVVPEFVWRNMGAIWGYALVTRGTSLLSSRIPIVSTMEAMVSTSEVKLCQG